MRASSSAARLDRLRPDAGLKIAAIICGIIKKFRVKAPDLRHEAEDRDPIDHRFPEVKVMNAVELLRRDYRDAIKLIKELEHAGGAAGTDPTAVETFNKLHRLLKMHLRMEEEVLHPRLKQLDPTRQLMRETEQKHSELNRVLKRLASLAPKTADFQDTLAELRDIIDYHLAREEAELFPKIEELSGSDELDQLGSRMEKIRNDSQIIASTTRHA
jgi:iron-sulfur cluster repair protein YtfE (RIC family)